MRSYSNPISMVVSKDFRIASFARRTAIGGLSEISRKFLACFEIKFDGNYFIDKSGFLRFFGSDLSSGQDHFHC